MFNRRSELVFDVPWEVDPLVLFKFLHTGVDDGAPGGLGVERREVGFREKLSDETGGFSGIDEIVDEKVAVTVARNAFEDVDRALDLGGGVVFAAVVTGDADGVDEANLKFARDKGGWYESATGDGDDAFPCADGVQHFGQIAGVAVKFDPGDDDIVGVGIA